MEREIYQPCNIWISECILKRTIGTIVHYDHHRFGGIRYRLTNNSVFPAIDLDTVYEQFHVIFHTHMIAYVIGTTHATLNNYCYAQNGLHGKVINIRTVRKLETNLKPAYHRVIKHSKLKWYRYHASHNFFYKNNKIKITYRGVPQFHALKSLF